MSIFSLEDGKFAINLAREAVKTFIETGNKITVPKKVPEQFKEKCGVFVTLRTLKKEFGELKKNLRGCIGFPYPSLPLVEAIIDSAISSATRDSRFHPPFGPGPVVPKELTEIIFEVSILTPPELIKVNNPQDYLSKIKIGRDGLIAEKGHFKGLLLPQVPVEWNWTVEQYLEHTCNKAYMPIDSWKKKETKIYAFQAIIFEEVKPLGEIKRKEIGED